VLIWCFILASQSLSINLDGGVDHRWKFGEQFELKFRAESFNLANTPHHASPTNSVNSGSFMQATDIRNTGRDGLDERTFRFGLRLSASSRKRRPREGEQRYSPAEVASNGGGHSFG
jgi:hypothetical protein